MLYLVVGDPHIRPTDVGEGKLLIKQIIRTGLEADVDAVVLMGDLFHYHEIYHAQVVAFWQEAIDLLVNNFLKVIVLVGNHDAPHDAEPHVHALSSLPENPRLEVVDRPTVEDGILFVPFMRDNTAFVETLQAHRNYRVVYCHQEFDGAKYENGFFAKHGVDPSSVPQTQVVSGHIHAVQKFDKVFYVGSPRWVSASDANQDRGIWLVEHDDEDHSIVKATFVSTEESCRKIYEVRDLQDAPIDPAQFPPNAKLFVDIVGDATWVQERKMFWKGRARYRALTKREARTKVRESDGISVAYQKYLDVFVPKMGTSKEILQALSKERLHGI